MCMGIIEKPPVKICTNHNNVLVTAICKQLWCKAICLRSVMGRNVTYPLYYWRTEYTVCWTQCVRYIWWDLWRLINPSYGMCTDVGEEPSAPICGRCRYPDIGNSGFLWNVSTYLPEYMVPLSVNLRILTDRVFSTILPLVSSLMLFLLVYIYLSSLDLLVVVYSEYFIFMIGIEFATFLLEC